MFCFLFEYHFVMAFFKNVESVNKSDLVKIVEIEILFLKLKYVTVIEFSHQGTTILCHNFIHLFTCQVVMVRLLKFHMYIQMVFAESTSAVSLCV